MENDIINVGQPGTKVELVGSDGYRLIWKVGQHRTYHGHEYEKDLSILRCWTGARDAAPAGYHLVVIDSPEENEEVRQLAEGNRIWLGGEDVYGVTYDTWDHFYWITNQYHNPKSDRDIHDDIRTYSVSDDHAYLHSLKNSPMDPYPFSDKFPSSEIPNRHRYRHPIALCHSNPSSHGYLDTDKHTAFLTNP